MTKPKNTQKNTLSNFHKHTIYEATKGLQKELYILHKRSPSPANKQAFVALLTNIVESISPHISRQKQELCNLDSALCKTEMTVREMCEEIYDNRENTKNLFSPSEYNTNHFTNWIGKSITGMLAGWMVYFEMKNAKYTLTKQIGNMMATLIIATLTTVTTNLSTFDNPRVFLLAHKASKKKQLADNVLTNHTHVF